MWLLCALKDTCLWSILLVCLIVGHTHDDLDRFFSRLKVALAGHDFYTVAAMCEVLMTNLLGFDVKYTHLMQTWGWKSLEDMGCPAFGALGHIHALNFFRHKGTWVKWKQFMTSSSWSTPILLIPEHRMADVAAWRPDLKLNKFKPAD